MKTKLKVLLSLFILSVLLFACSSSEADSSDPVEITDAVAKSGDIAGSGDIAESGDALKSFELIQKGRFENLNSDTEVYEHKKTGAKVMFILNDDTNRLFNIGFRTPIVNDNGVAHILEHSVLCGSEKYPSRSLLDNASYQLYINSDFAETGYRTTQYHIASLSEKQLLKTADVYIDSVFNPNVLKDERIFRTEGWRYSLDSADADLRIDGTVYNEMKGNDTVSFWSRINAFSSLYPGSFSNNSFGGNPEHIPDLTWEDIKKYHSEYYKPSNSLTVIYGKIDDKEGFLKLLNGYFDNYEKENIAIDDRYTVIDSLKEDVYVCAASEDTSEEGQAIISYSFALGEYNAELFNYFEVLTSVLNRESSVFQTKLMEKMPEAVGYCDIDYFSPEMTLFFNVEGLDEKDKYLFKNIVDETISEYCLNGIDDRLVDSISSSLEMSILLMNDDSETGLTLSRLVMDFWSAFDSFTIVEENFQQNMNLKELNKQGIFPEILKKYCVDNPRRALVVTKPEPGLTEKREAELNEKLSAIKASMTQEEIENLVGYSQELFEASQDDPSEYIEALRAVDVSSLPEERKSFEIRDNTGEDGIRRIDSVCDIDGIGRSLIAINVSDFSEEELQLLTTYFSLLGSLDTPDHSSDEIIPMIAECMSINSIEIKSRVTDQGIENYIYFDFTSLTEKLQNAYDCVYELLFKPVFSDTELISAKIGQYKKMSQSNINSDPAYSAIYASLGAGVGDYYVSSLTSGFEYYDFLCRLEEMLKTEPDMVIDLYGQLVEKIRCNKGMMLGYCGNEESIAINRPIADAFAAKLDNSRDISVLPFELSEKKAIGYVVDSSVHCNILSAALSETTSEKFDARMQVVQNIITQAYLNPQIRDKNGAYGAQADMNFRFVGFYSWDDPNIDETFEVYSNIDKFIDDLKLDRKTLDNYIVSVYSDYVFPKGELSGAADAVYDYFYRDTTSEDYFRYMRQLKSMKVEDIKRFAEPFINLGQKGYFVSTGSSESLLSSEIQFADVINLFSKDELLSAYSDIEEDGWYREAITVCLDHNLLNPFSDDYFGVYEAATVGDFALPVVSCIGENVNDGQEALEVLRSYGIELPDSAGMLMTKEELSVYMVDICEAMGVDFSGAEFDISVYQDAGQISDENRDKLAYAIMLDMIYIGEDNMIYPSELATMADLAYMLKALL